MNQNSVFGILDIIYKETLYKSAWPWSSSILKVHPSKFEIMVRKHGSSNGYRTGNAFHPTPWAVRIWILSGNGQLEVVEKTLQTASTFFAFLLANQGFQYQLCWDRSYKLHREFGLKIVQNHAMECFLTSATTSISKLKRSFWVK